MTHYHLFETALGFAGIAWSDEGIARFRLPNPDREAARKAIAMKGEESDPPPAVAEIVSQAQRYFAGERIDFSGIELNLGGVDPTRRLIYSALRQVSFGKTVTYGELAKRAGVNAPQAALGGFSAPGRTETKEKMLALEGVFIGNQPRLL
jgi:methylated-DNA-[protein]-cysteine S-methyltransferase